MQVFVFNHKGNKLLLKLKIKEIVYIYIYICITPEARMLSKTSSTARLAVKIARVGRSRKASKGL